MGTLAMYNVLGIATRLNVLFFKPPLQKLWRPHEHPQSESYLGNVNTIGPQHI